jgi:archaellum biogenesis ATPase FlaH
MVQDWAEVSECFARWLQDSEKCKGRRSGDRVDGHCPRPGHDDKDPSFSYYVGKAGWACSCGRGKASELMKELGIDFGSPAPTVVASAAPTIVASYDYLDEAGMLQYQVQRLVPKSFRQRSASHINGAEFRWKEGKGAMDGVRLLPYCLPALLRQPAGTQTLIVDGEKDVQTAWKMGIPATCATGGMARWNKELAMILPPALKYIVIADRDRDGKGRKDAEKVVELLGALSQSAHVAEMPGDGVKDLTDWVEHGGSVETIGEVLEKRSRWDEVARSPIVPTSSLTHLIDAQIEYIVRPICPRGSLIIVQGAPKSGKSVFTLEVANCAANGDPVGGVFHVERPMKVLFVEYEDAPMLVVKRLSRYLAGHHRDPRQLPENLLFCDYPDLWLDSQRHKDLLIEEIKSRGIDLVVLDTLSYVHQAEDENSAADMKPVMANLKRIAKDSGASIVLVHHAGKGAKDKSISERGRGSSVIAAAADVILDWGDRKRTNKTPVEFISKYDDGFEFEVEYAAMTDGAVEWRVITPQDQDQERKTRKDEILEKIKQKTLRAPSGFPLSELIVEMKHISEQIVYREVRKIEKDGMLWVSKAGQGGAKTIRFIDQTQTGT